LLDIAECNCENLKHSWTQYFHATKNPKWSGKYPNSGFSTKVFSESFDSYQKLQFAFKLLFKFFVSKMSTLGKIGSTSVPSFTPQIETRESTIPHDHLQTLDEPVSETIVS